MEDKFKCDYCGDTFASVRELNIHKAKEHASDEAEKMRYPCSRCGEVLHSPLEVAEHMKKVHPEAVRWINIVWWTITIAAILFVLWHFLT